MNHQTQIAKNTREEELAMRERWEVKEISVCERLRVFYRERDKNENNKENKNDY